MHCLKTLGGVDYTTFLPYMRDGQMDKRIAGWIDGQGKYMMLRDYGHMGHK